ncbi:MAG: alpha/beta hydrolase [Clostridiales bacterium]|nr:alpha/beta hydrolase [Clostridiales bacterium]
MLEKIIAFFMAIIAFFMQLFGISSNSGNTYTEYNDVAYGTDAAQVMDICLPDDASGEVGLVVFIHGGAWVEGDKSSYMESAEYSATLGYAAATINYRMLYEGYDCNDIMEDVTSALCKIQEYAENDGITIGKVAFGGASAGGHIALLYSYKYASESPFPVAFCFSYSGPTDLTDPEFLLNSSLGLETTLDIAGRLAGVALTEDNINDEDIQAALKAVSPVSYVTESSVPTLMCHGSVDTMVPYSNAVTLDAALTAAGVTHDFYTYPNSGHSLADDPDVSEEVNDKLMEYVAAYLN